MGHIRLGALPRSRKWRDLVELIQGGGDVDAVSAATIEAADKGLKWASQDEGLAQTVWMLAQLPLAARTESYEERLWELGLDRRAKDSVADLIASFSEALDARFRKLGKGRTNLGEMAQMAAVEVLSAELTRGTGDLFATGPDVRGALHTFSTTKGFSTLARAFFARLTNRYLSFFLSRELPNNVGPGRRFATVAEHSEFDSALSLHCTEASHIVQVFAGGWLSKKHHETGITEADARSFAWAAFKKIRAELREGAAGPRQ